MLFADIVESRLNMAKKLGADDTYLVQKDKAENDMVVDIHTIFGEEPNRTIDASGAQASIRLAILVSFKDTSEYIQKVTIWIVIIFLHR